MHQNQYVPVSLNKVSISTWEHLHLYDFPSQQPQELCNLLPNFWIESSPRADATFVLPIIAYHDLQITQEVGEHIGEQMVGKMGDFSLERPSVPHVPYSRIVYNLMGE